MTILPNIAFKEMRPNTMLPIRPNTGSFCYSAPLQRNIQGTVLAAQNPQNPSDLAGICPNCPFLLTGSNLHGYFGFSKWETSSFFTLRFVSSLEVSVKDFRRAKKNKLEETP